MAASRSWSAVSAGSLTSEAKWSARSTGRAVGLMSRCGTYPIEPRSESALSSTSWPPTRSCPAAISRSPRIARTSVLLPAPLGPSTQINSPGSILRLTSLRSVL